MKIVAFEIEPWEKDAFGELEVEHEVVFTQEPLTRENAELYIDADILSVFIYSEADAEVLKRFPALKLITTRSTGYDHIDTEYCRQHDIEVANVPSYGKNTVAEHVFGLLLTMSHHLDKAVERTRRGNFSMKGLRGFDLMGKTIGVIGTGDIGKHVIRIACGFEMNILAYDLKPDQEASRRFGFRYVGMDELLRKSDIITLHVPAVKSTENMIAQPQFEMMKPGAILINTARGNVVEVEAMLRALATGKLKAAGLDVLPEEPSVKEEAQLLSSIFLNKHNLDTLLANHVLFKRENVYITPHSAFNTTEAVERILKTTVENIAGYIRQKHSPNAVKAAIAA